MMGAREYQRIIKEKLKDTFNDIRIEEPMQFTRNIYTPRIDVAVGPFAYKERLIERYNELLREYVEFIEKIKEKAINKGYLDFNSNVNPRCFIAIEIEKSTEKDTKHLLGSITNASILGKVGILIVFNNRKGLEKMNNLFNFARQVGKIQDYLFKNVALLTKEDFDNILREDTKSKKLNIQNNKYRRKNGR